MPTFDKFLAFAKSIGGLILIAVILTLIGMVLFPDMRSILLRLCCIFVSGVLIGYVASK